MMPRTLIPTLLAAMALAGCTLAPRYERPGLPVSPTWPMAVAVAPPLSGEASASDLAWREVFTDPRLQAVIDQALTQNRDLRVAVGNIEKARARYRVQRAQLLPTINAVGSQTKTSTPPALTNGRQADFEQYSATVGVSGYELDLFGRVRSLSEAALQDYFSVEETRRAVQISLIAEVAGSYLTLAADQDLLKVTEDTAASRDAALDLTRKRFDAGATSMLDLRQAQTLAEQARSDVAVATARVSQDRNALTLTVGADVPESVLPNGGLTGVGVRAELSAGLPSEVLTRRPDVLAAEHALRAQNANIGAARAAFFPRITLTGSNGSGSTELDGLFQAGTRLWSFTPQVVLPLFAGGANLANLRDARAGRDVAVAQYEKAIQTAFREVSDALAVRATLRERIAAQERLVEAAADARRLSQARYDSGIDSYLVLLDAQRTDYAARQTLLSAQLVEAVNRVTLYKTLGGGPPPPPRK